MPDGHDVTLARELRVGPGARKLTHRASLGTRRIAISNRHDCLFPPLPGVERSIVRSVLGQRCSSMHQQAIQSRKPRPVKVSWH